MTTSSAPARAGVAGWPIEHSRSPMIHQFWFDLCGIEAGYERFPVPPGAFAEFAARIGKDGLVGSNVTVPHKVTAFAACDRRTPVRPGARRGQHALARGRALVGRQHRCRRLSRRTWTNRAPGWRPTAAAWRWCRRRRGGAGDRLCARRSRFRAYPDRQSHRPATPRTWPRPVATGSSPRRGIGWTPP